MLYTKGFIFQALFGKQDDLVRKSQSSWHEAILDRGLAKKRIAVYHRITLPGVSRNPDTERLAKTQETDSEQQRRFKHRGCEMALFKVGLLIRTIEWAVPSV